VGKGTLVQRLLQLRPDLAYSVSCTTRPPREEETHGRDYRFVAPERFQELIDQGAFLEWAQVYGHRYGTLAAPVAAALEGGSDVVLELDMQGARAVRERVPDSVLIFLEPPSMAELERRLRERGTESEEHLARRLSLARDEMLERSWFDAAVLNDDVERAATEVAAIIERVSGSDAASGR
jgi:guanylate kinase